MISDVVCLHPYDRIFCVLSIWFTLGVFQCNARAQYKRLYGISSTCTNDLLYTLAMVGCFALPCVGLFDEHQFRMLHIISAVAFFSCIGFYAFIVGGEMDTHKDKFPEAQNEIKMMNGMKWIMLGTLVTFGISAGLFGPDFWLTPASEWAIVLIYVNYFAVLAMSSPYYDTIHPYGQLANKN
jgi:hypothetical protein